MNAEDVKRLRKAGQLRDAREAALEILGANPQDFRTKAEYEWVIYGYVKEIVAKVLEAQEKHKSTASGDLEELLGWLREYYRLGPQRPGMAYSNIVGQVIKVGARLPTFPDIIRWVGFDGLRPEDWQSRLFKGKPITSLVVKTARALCKWVKAHPDATDQQLSMALEWADRASSAAKGDDILWLKWDKGTLLRQMGDFRRAAECLSSVIRTKRNEFWVWAEAGRLYSSEQPDLALACFCRALECPAEPKFLVKAHCELAELLAEQEEFAQASREITIAVEVRKAEGWSIRRELESLISQSWYDPSAAGAEDPKEFYAKHSHRALALCFDVVEEREANYLGLLEPRRPKERPPNWKPRQVPLFAIRDGDGHSWSLVGPRMKKLKFDVGAPLIVTVGRQDGDDRQIIAHVSVRKDGEQWDCLDVAFGVITREATDHQSARVLVAATGEELDVNGAPKTSLCIGQWVQLGLARNPKSKRAEVFNVHPAEPPRDKTKLVRGQLRRNPQGFAFVDDAFVPKHIVESIQSNASEVVAEAIYAKRRDKGDWGWRVIKLKPP